MQKIVYVDVHLVSTFTRKATPFLSITCNLPSPIRYNTYTKNSLQRRFLPFEQRSKFTYERANNFITLDNEVTRVPC